VDQDYTRFGDGNGIGGRDGTGQTGGKRRT